jgi:hypothetical protein
VASPTPMHYDSSEAIKEIIRLYVHTFERRSTEESSEIFDCPCFFFLVRYRPVVRGQCFVNSG